MYICIYIKYNYNRKQAAPVKCRGGEEDRIDDEPDCTDKTHTGILHHCTNVRIAYNLTTIVCVEISCLSHVHVIRWIGSILFHMLFNKILNYSVNKFILSFSLYETLRKIDSIQLIVEEIEILPDRCERICVIKPGISISVLNPSVRIRFKIMSMAIVAPDRPIPALQ